jgi:DNA modification methylase
MNTLQNSRLTIEYVDVDSLVASPHNPRKHSKRQLEKLAASMNEFTFTVPISVDADNNVIAGHARLLASKLAGMKTVPVIRFRHLSPVQIRAYMLADNRLAEMAEWDESALAIQLQYFIDIENGFDVTLTGFEVPEVDLILQEVAAPVTEEENVEPPSFGTTVARSGDIFELGRHRIVCGDSLESETWLALMEGKQADVVFADPPYNVPIPGHASGNGSIHHPNFAMASGEMSSEEFTAFLTREFLLLVEHSKPGSLHYICMDWRHIGEVTSASNALYDSLVNLCVWAKSNGGMGSFYRSQHELIFVFRNGHDRHRNNIQLGRYGRNRTNLWNYPSVNSLSRNGEEGNLLAIHPTVKPVALVADALLDCSAAGDIVCDPFLGSGSTLLAAERTGRICRGIEIDPSYVDAAVRRWQRHTGASAIHLLTGKPFDELAGERGELRRG